MTTSDTLIRFSHPESGRYMVRRFTNGEPHQVTDVVTVEEPLDVRITYSFKDVRKTESIAVTMRTPGHERELAAGFLLSEGVITAAGDLIEVRQLGGEHSNEVVAELHEGTDVETWRLRRSTMVSSACGLCGKSAMEALALDAGPLDAGPWEAGPIEVAARLIGELPSMLLKRQTAFGESGGLHAAALITSAGEIEAVFEDIGRHNALDKLIGSRVLAGQLPVNDRFVFMSSRGSFELVQKCRAARCAVLVTIGAPSSLAIDFARANAMTLAGFIRPDHFNVYSGEWRIASH